MPNEPNPLSDRIHIDQLEISAHIGVPEEERAMPLRLTVSISFWPYREQAPVLASPKKRTIETPVKYWELVADKLSKAGWSLGWVSAVDSEGRTIWIVDAHRDDGKRFVVRSDEKLTAFLELERITHELALSALLGDGNV